MSSLPSQFVSRCGVAPASLASDDVSTHKTGGSMDADRIAITYCEE